MARRERDVLDSPDSGLGWADLLRWAWLTLIAAIVELWRRLTGLTTRTALLEQHKEHLALQRAEDQKRWDKEREQDRDSIRRLHDKIDRLSSDLRTVSAPANPPRPPDS